MSCKEFLKPAVSNNITAKLASTLCTLILIQVLIHRGSIFLFQWFFKIKYIRQYIFVFISHLI